MFLSQLRASIYLYNLMPPLLIPCPRKPNKRTYSTAQHNTLGTVMPGQFLKVSLATF